MLLKSLEFITLSGQKVRVVEIPILQEGSTYRFMVNMRLQSYLAKVNAEPNPKKVYSFKEYLKKVLKWPDYQEIFKSSVLRHNA